MWISFLHSATLGDRHFFDVLSLTRGRHCSILCDVCSLTTGNCLGGVYALWVLFVFQFVWVFDVPRILGDSDRCWLRVKSLVCRQSDFSLNWKSTSTAFFLRGCKLPIKKSKVEQREIKAIFSPILSFALYVVRNPKSNMKTTMFRQLQHVHTRLEVYFWGNFTSTPVLGVFKLLIVS